MGYLVFIFLLIYLFDFTKLRQQNDQIIELLEKINQSRE